MDNEIRAIRESQPVFDNGASQVPRSDAADEDINSKIQSMNMQVHKLSAYIIQHERRFNEIQRELAKMCDVYSGASPPMSGPPIDIEVLNLIVEPDNQSYRNVSTVFCFVRKFGLNEYNMYKKFIKFGEIVKLSKSTKRKFGFINSKS